MKKIIFIFLFLCLSLFADSEKTLLDDALFESAITSQQKIAINKYFQNIVIQKENDLKRLEDKLLLSYGGKSLRDKIIKDNIKIEIFEIENQIKHYKIAINELRK
jgi:hypothetical protein